MSRRSSLLWCLFSLVLLNPLDRDVPTDVGPHHSQEGIPAGLSPESVQFESPGIVETVSSVPRIADGQASESEPDDRLTNEVNPLQAEVLSLRDSRGQLRAVLDRLLI